MNELGVEVFDKTSDYCELRLFTGGGSARMRGLNRATVDSLVESVESAYAQDSAGRRVFGSTQLRELGQQLYAFLDGDERWLADELTDPAGSTVRITAEQRLRHLPWELLAADGAHLAASSTHTVLPVRASRRGASLTNAQPLNRPLRVLFMATSPEGVEPVLNYENEEARILQATAETEVELVVEESGTLDGLRFTAESHGAGYFDVLHISGHATIHEGQPRFVVEDEVGSSVLASADDVVRAMTGQWPRLVFLSGCLSGGAPAQGTMPSMSESLVDAGAPLVLGWALPVGDVSASEFAAQLYQALAAGRPIDQAVVTARRHLHALQSSCWHLLRVYADASPLTAMVTPLRTPGRPRVAVRHAADVFLDPQTQQSRVASRENFVGRRRVIQRCLRTLKAHSGTASAAEALVLQGMGGLGKSTLASRLLERMPTHQRAVWYGRVDLVEFRKLIDKVDFPTLNDSIKAAELLDNDQADLAVRLRYLLTGPLATTPCLFVFDDFEQGNLDERDGGHVLSPEMAQLLPALLAAIRDTNSPSRVIITSRYGFPSPTGVHMVVETLETLTQVEQAKKLANLTNLRAESPVDSTLKDRAVHAAAGNPRLLDWLDKVVADPALDVDGVITAIENEADRFRETILAQKLLDTLPTEARTMLARLNVIELPAPTATVQAMHTHPDADTHVRRAVALGLLEEGIDPQAHEQRYFVSNVLRPLLRPLLTDDDYTDACAAAARSLYEIWVTGPAPAPTDGTTP